MDSFRRPHHGTMVLWGLCVNRSLCPIYLKVRFSGYKIFDACFHSLSIWNVFPCFPLSQELLRSVSQSVSQLLQLCLTLCDPMDCSLPGSSVHGYSPGKHDLESLGDHSIITWEECAWEWNQQISDDTVWPLDPALHVAPSTPGLSWASKSRATPTLREYFWSQFELGFWHM